MPVESFKKQGGKGCALRLGLVFVSSYWRYLLSCSKHSRRKPIPSRNRLGNGWVLTLLLGLSDRTRSIDNCDVGVSDLHRGPANVARDESTNPPRQAKIRSGRFLSKSPGETR